MCHSFIVMCGSFYFMLTCDYEPETRREYKSAREELEKEDNLLQRVCNSKQIGLIQLCAVESHC